MEPQATTGKGNSDKSAGTSGRLSFIIKAGGEIIPAMPDDEEFSPQQIRDFVAGPPELLGPTHDGFSSSTTAREKPADYLPTTWPPVCIGGTRTERRTFWAEFWWPTRITSRRTGRTQRSNQAVSHNGDSSKPEPSHGFGFRVWSAKAQ